MENEDTEYIQLPVEWLKEISLVGNSFISLNILFFQVTIFQSNEIIPDTPGTNAVITGHQKLTEHFVPRSDMVLFVTSTDRAFSESESIFYII